MDKGAAKAEGGTPAPRGVDPAKNLRRHRHTTRRRTQPRTYVNTGTQLEEGPSQEPTST